MMSSSWSSRPIARKSGTAQRLARLFVERLAQGMIVDRTVPKLSGRFRKKVVAPDALAKFWKPL